MEFPALRPKTGYSNIGLNLKSLQSRFILFLSALLWVSVAVAQPPPKVVFLVPNPPNDQPFWTQATEIMEAVAEDLNIDLKIAYSKPSSYSQKKDGLRVLNSRPAPDYFLSLYLIEASPHHLELAEKLGIRTFIFNAGVIPGDREKIGQPRGKYRHWIGQMVPEDRQAGYLLADALIAQAKAAGKTDKLGKVHLIDVGAFGASIDESRDNGLHKRINEQNDVVLDKTLLTGWSPSTAYNEALDALKEYPDADAIWCVSDATALAAVKAAKASGKTPGKDIFIGGIDWSPEGIEAVASGDLAVSVGGHFLDGAKALILIHDYHYGIDFADELGVEMETQMKTITTDNSREYLDQLSKLDWREVDFKKFSRKYNPKLKTYDLSLHSLFSSLQSEP